jgi:undecaprenyl-diphosphatase
MSIWEAVLLGIIQGLTEFLPISSTAHLLVARQLLGHANPRDAFTTAIQLGTLVAVFVYFRSDLYRMSVAVLADFRSRRFASTPDSRLFWMMVVATFPVVICGFAFKDFIKRSLYDTWVIAVAAIGFSILLLVAEILARQKTGREEDRVTWLDALLVGLFQTLALIPGASRSGVTITAGLFAGLSRPTAARLSFLLSLPSILGAGLYDSYKDRHELFQSDADVLNLLVGATVAGIVGYLSIAWLIGFLKRYSTFGFIIYRVALGLIIFALLAKGWLVSR